jgi:hypothetical protein
MSTFKTKVSSLGWLVVVVGSMEFPIFKLSMEQEDEWRQAAQLLARAELTFVNVPTSDDDAVLHYSNTRFTVRDAIQTPEFERHIIYLTREFLAAITMENNGRSSPLILSIKKLREMFGRDANGMVMSLYGAKTIVETLAFHHFLPFDHIGNPDKTKEYPKDDICWIEWQNKKLS